MRKPSMVFSKPRPMPVAPPTAGMAPSKPRPMPVAGRDTMSKPAMAPSKPQLMDAPGKMKSGGKVGRGDGCCMKGKTKGAMC
jgi:hypothetical protein